MPRAGKSGKIIRMSPYDPVLLELTDYFPTAVELRPLVMGESGDWHPKVVGVDPETGGQVTVASWPLEYEHKRDAEKRAREMFADVKRRRRATLLVQRMAEGLIDIDDGEYVGIAGDGTEVRLGAVGEEEQIESYLRANPLPQNW